MAPSEKHGTVLVVEDDPLILNICREMLDRLRYRVLLADTPLKALERMRESRDEIHLLVTDVVMPEMADIKDKKRRGLILIEEDETSKDANDKDANDRKLYQIALSLRMMLHKRRFN